MSELASKPHTDKHTPEVTVTATIEQQNTLLSLLCRLAVAGGLTEHQTAAVAAKAAAAAPLR